jgi:hypothetical protein
VGWAGKFFEKIFLKNFLGNAKFREPENISGARESISKG